MNDVAIYRESMWGLDRMAPSNTRHDRARGHYNNTTPSNNNNNNNNNDGNRHSNNNNTNSSVAILAQVRSAPWCRLA